MTLFEQIMEGVTDDERELLRDDAVLSPLIDASKRVSDDPDGFDAALVLMLKRHPDGSVTFCVDSCSRVTKAGAIAMLRGAADALEESNV